MVLCGHRHNGVSNCSLNLVQRLKETIMNIKHLLKEHAYRNIPLSFDEGYELGLLAIQGCKGYMANPDELRKLIQSIAALSALHTRATYSWEQNGETISHDHHLPQNAAEQIAGICAAVFEHDIGDSEFGFLQPQVPYVIDNCGMGGDLTVTANVSTISAFIAASLGIPVCKHGSPSNADKGRHGSSDFISLCGIDEYGTRDQVETLVEELGFGYTEALDTRFKLIHLQTHKVAQMPHMNDLIGPITNPVNPHLLTRRVIGVNHLVDPVVVAEAYRIMNERGVINMEHLIAVRGFGDDNNSGDMDELSVCAGGTAVAELKDGVIQEYRLYAEDFGIEPVSSRDISPPEGMSKGEFSIRILRGEIDGLVLKMILANAALLVRLAHPELSLPECYGMAQEALSSGAAYQKMLNVRNAHPKNRS
jgi:anthranilate phosphoribosyltransferase